MSSSTHRRPVSLATIPAWIAALIWALGTGTGVLFGGMMRSSLSFSCTRASGGELVCDVAQRDGVHDREARLRLGPKSRMRVLPVMTSSDTPNTVALQIFPLDNSVFQTLPSEDRAPFDAVLHHLEACQASTAPRCAYGVDRGGGAGMLVGLLLAISALAGALACLTRTRVAVEGERFRVQRTLFGLPIQTRLDIPRTEWLGVELERDDTGETEVGRVILLRKAATDGEMRFVLITMSPAKAAEAVHAVRRLR